MTQEAAPAPIVLIDGSSYLFRAYHALPPLTTSKGQPTGAIKGVISMIRRLQQDYPRSPLIAVFDAKGRTFRHDLYADYKANRPPMPEDLGSQVEPIFAIVRAMGIPLLVEKGVEADDVIGTLACQATANGREAIISTGDKDMAQLVSEHVTLINTMTGTCMDREGVREKFGVTPEQIIDYLALVGDTSDNIPGVNKCGPKTAVKWLQEYGDLDNLMANASGIKGKIGEYLRAAEEQLPCSRDLATIRTSVPLEHTLENTRMREPDPKALLELYTEYEFRAWIAELEGGDASEAETAPTVTPINTSAADTHYEIITTQPDFDRWLDRLKSAPEFAFDTETTGLNYMTAELVGVSFAVEPGTAAYVPVKHDYMGAPEQLDREAVLEALRPLLENPAVRKIGQNLKYDKNILANHGICLEGIAEDTMLQSYVLDSVASRHDMDSLALRYLNRRTTTFEEIAGKGAKQLTFNAIDVNTGGHYACEDADITLALHRTLRPQLAQAPGLDYVYSQIDMPLVPVLARMERRGARVNPDLLRRQSQELAEKMANLEEAAYAEAGEAFNLGSPKQLQVLLYEKLGLPVVKKTPKGAPSTAEPVLAELALTHALPRLILDHRSLSKLKSTYTDKLPHLINSQTGRIHTSYHQAVTATGRLSSSDPNLQNIPIRTEEGRRIRQAFVATEGYKLVAADYSQIELRIMAHLSADEGLMKAFANGEDIHKATAAEVFGVPLEAVSGDQRRSAKAINFGLIYGMSAWGLARTLGIGRDTAQAYVDRYFERYPGVLEYMDRTRTLAHDQGYVETLFGRRLYLPEINNRNRNLQQAAERTAINAPMQGTAADIIKRAMVAVEDWLLQSNADARMTMQVHDELILEVREEDLPKIVGGLEQRMCAAADLRVPLLVETGVGENWDEAH
ncbi:DNA polymerase I [Hydrocarboniclastica marina]|uniref:DNA polymerase I n=1 Tax=Hydrocarboniclastica marina TaxID=2259620 RepID=A0A4P7XD52_9ALTE|nr:DNA polymerase I [Hydrocarboniclastica marina]QCF24799.1 DNA polymerase I [Hydrocarboniclastica marina]